jgi:AraC family transcriptional regulator
MRVPAVRYAVFLHAGNVATIQETWKQILERWLPSSGMKSAQTPDFEVYDERFDGATGDGGVEIWLGVKPAT